MVDFTKVLIENPNGVLATYDGERVKTRVFQYLFTIDGNIYFCTGNDKEVYQQLKQFPRVSFCTYASDFSPVLSVNGKAHFVDDVGLKKRVLDENPGIKAIYQSHENPVFELFFIDAEEYDTFSFEEGPRKYSANH